MNPATPVTSVRTLSFRSSSLGAGSILLDPDGGRKAVRCTRCPGGDEPSGMPDRAPALEARIEGLAFPECTRWYGGRLWFSDMHAGRVVLFDGDGSVRTIAEVPGDPGGLGWLPDGRLLVVSMRNRQVLRLDP